MRIFAPPSLSTNAPTRVLLSRWSEDRQTAQSHPTCGTPKLVPVPRKVSFSARVRLSSDRTYAEPTERNHRVRHSLRIADDAKTRRSDGLQRSLISPDLRVIDVQRHEGPPHVDGQCVGVAFTRTNGGGFLPWNQRLPSVHPVARELEASADRDLECVVSDRRIGGVSEANSVGVAAGSANGRRRRGNPHRRRLIAQRAVNASRSVLGDADRVPARG